jgi:hypothetical protein
MLMPLDALHASWILVAFLFAFFWFPARLFSRRPNGALVMRIAGNWVRMTLCMTVAVFLLASLRTLSAITVIGLLGAGLATAWLRKHDGTTRSVTMSLRTTTLRILRNVESRSFGLHLLPRLRRPVSASSRLVLCVNHWLSVWENRKMLVASFVVVLMLTGALSSEHALRELRFDHPEQYATLLRARELMLESHSGGRPFVFPALIVTTSLLSGTDPMQVTRFLSPVLGILVVLAVGLLIHACTRMGVASVVGMYCLGAAAFPVARNDAAVATSAMQKIESLLRYPQAMTRASTEFELGLVFLLLALAFLADWSWNSRWDCLLDLFCCLLLLGIVSQFLLLIFMIPAMVVLIRPAGGLVTFVPACYVPAAYATLSTGSTVPNEVFALLPVAASIAVGCCLALTEATIVARAGRTAETILLIACLGIAVIWLRPHRLIGQHLEYEAAVRQTEEIKYRFPRQRWLVVAPVEQFPETLGFGMYEDLAEFVEKYRNQVSSPEFRFQGTPEDLFVYVEKRPFQMFSREPQTVSFPVLTDATYRNYRSPAGRASLESAALRLCESYRQHNSHADVFFEDENLRVYHIHQQRAPGY